MLSLTEMFRDEYAKKPIFGLSYLSAGNICVEDYQNVTFDLWYKKAC